MNSQENSTAATLLNQITIETNNGRYEAALALAKAYNELCQAAANRESAELAY